jgi:hypothetical protein
MVERTLLYYRTKTLYLGNTSFSVQGAPDTKNALQSYAAPGSSETKSEGYFS